MAVNHEDIQELKKVFDDRYVLQSDCDATQQKINNKFANDDKRIELLINQQIKKLYLEQMTEKVCFRTFPGFAKTWIYIFPV